MDIHNLLQDFKEGDRRSLARLLTIVERNLPGKKEVMKEIFPLCGRAFVVGITGSPGAGKSSLIDLLCTRIEEEVQNIGVIAIDPSSPFSGGAIFGDRLRMRSHNLNENIFIRSMGNRGTPGGLSKATRDAIRLLDAFGKEIIIVETVGVGQAELEIMEVADTVIVILIPGTGDAIQILKAGVMEIAAIYAVNKSDRSGSAQLASDLKSFLGFAHNRPFTPPVVMTSVPQKTGLQELWEAVKDHKEYLLSSGRFEEKRLQGMERELKAMVMEDLERSVDTLLSANPLSSQSLQALLKGEQDPFTLSQEIIQQLKENRG